MSHMPQKRLQCLCSFITLATVARTQFVPLVTTGASSSFVENKAMYISGGYNRPQRAVPQMFAIDLSTAWDTNAPKAIELSSVNSLPDAVVPNAALNSIDGNLVIFSKGYSNVYDPRKNQWSNPITVPYFDPKDGFHLSGAADPRSGLIYIPSGYVTGPTGNITTTMLQYDPIRGTSTSLSMSGSPGLVKGYTIIWSAYLKKFVVYSGYLTADPLNILAMYDPTSYTWSQPAIYNAAPPPRVRHCSVPYENGKKMLVFGGFNDSKWTATLDDLYELDLSSYTWTKRASAGTSLGRGLMVCAISNGYFIAWGGQNKAGIVTANPTLVYSIKDNAWVTNYWPGEKPPGAGSGGGGGGSKVGIIIAVVASILAILIAGVAFYLWKRRKSQPQKMSSMASSIGTLPTSSDPEFGDGNHGNMGPRPMSEINLWAPPTAKADAGQLAMFETQHTIDEFAEQQKLQQPYIEQQQQPYTTTELDYGQQLQQQQQQQPYTVEMEYGQQLQLQPESMSTTPSPLFSWTSSQGTVVQSPDGVYAVANNAAAERHSHNPQQLYPDYFPPPPPTAGSRMSFSGSGTAVSDDYQNGDSIKIEYKNRPTPRAPHEIVPYVEPVERSGPQGIVVPNSYVE
ncbi:hypothetical protein BGZ94_009329 [Podila epigama]|nr:hypothetical protein BGZ94_009329 [Podila epigama]